MPKYLMNYQTLSDFHVVVEADDDDAARGVLIDSPHRTIHVGGVVRDWIMTDIYYDTIDISEVTE